MQKITLWVVGFSLCFFSSSCFLFQVSSRRERFVKGIVAPSAKPSHKVLLGEPDSRAVPVEPGASLVVSLHVPTYPGYGEALTVYIPKKWAHEGEYLVSVGHQATGPWTPIGVASSTRTFDIDGTPFSASHYVQIKALRSSRSKVWLDAVKLRVHTKEWQPPLYFQTKMKPKQANKRFNELWQKGQRFFEQRKYKRARDYLRAALSLRHKHAPVLYMLGATYYALEEHYQAIRHYQWAFQYGSPAREHLQEIASSYMALKQHRSALPHVERCMSIAPLYPPCYYKRLHLASLAKNRTVLEFYTEIYRIVKRRTHIMRRGWSLQKFLATYFSKRAPIISVYPHLFTCKQHLEWINFLLRLFPNDQQSVMFFCRSGLDARWQMLKTSAQKRQCQYYRALYFHRVKQPKRSLAILKRLEATEKRLPWLGRIYLLHGHVLEKSGRAEEAMKVYHRAHKRLGTTKYGRPFFVKVMGKSISSLTQDPPPQRR